MRFRRLFKIAHSMLQCEILARLKSPPPALNASRGTRPDDQPGRASRGR
jgi:hypothetical protein